VSVENEVGLVEVLINNAGISRDAMTTTTGVATAKIISRKYVLSTRFIGRLVVSPWTKCWTLW
jgi:hypothetical protein